MVCFYVIFHVFPEKMKGSGFLNFVKVVKKFANFFFLSWENSKRIKIRENISVKYCSADFDYDFTRKSSENILVKKNSWIHRCIISERNLSLYFNWKVWLQPELFPWEHYLEEKPHWALVSQLTQFPTLFLVHFRYFCLHNSNSIQL